MIKLCDLTKDYPIGVRGVKLRALDGLTLSVPKGQIYGLLGPNGSGKSTTIKIILGLVEPTAGECLVDGLPCGRVEARVNLGYMPEAPHFYRHMTGRELVIFYGGICGLEGARLRARTNEVIAWVGMSAAADRRVGTYSKGMLQRIGLAQAVVHDPALVILDEPTAGVDPLGVEAMTTLILELKARGKTVLITSHLLPQMEAICDRVALLNRGRLLLEGAIGDLLPKVTREGVWMDSLPERDQELLVEWLASRGRKTERLGMAGVGLERIFIEQIGARNALAGSPN